MVERYQELKQLEQLNQLIQQRKDAEQCAEIERQATRDAVRRTLQMGLSVEQVAQAFSLTVQEIDKMK